MPHFRETAVDAETTAAEAIGPSEPETTTSEPATGGLAMPEPAAPEPTAHEDNRPRGLRERIAFAAFRVGERFRLGVATAYLAAGSLIGFEFLLGVLSFSTMWPAFIPLVLGVLALVHYLRKRLRRMTGRRRPEE